MLKERTDVRQRADESHRRWWVDGFFDLIVWTNDAGDVVLFQLAYDPDGADGLIEWRPASGLSHFKVDTAERKPARHARAGFLIPSDPPEDLSDVLRRFEEASGSLEAGLRAFVLDRLQEARR